MVKSFRTPFEAFFQPFLAGKALQCLRLLAMLLCGLALTEPAHSKTAARAPSFKPLSTAQCGDFLAQAKFTIAQLEYVECTRTDSGQIPHLEARYRVKGEHAAPVEKALMRKTGMARLRFVCCIWEPWPKSPSHQRYGALGSGYEFSYEINMGAGETVYGRRQAWAKIDYFYVTVTLPLASP